MPGWAVRSVVGALVGVEPFRFFHRVGMGAGRCGRVKTLGMSGMGWKAYWDVGGGGDEEDEEEEEDERYEVDEEQPQP